MENSNVTSITNSVAGKKAMSKGLKIALIVMSAIFFIAAIVTPVVIFTMPREQEYKETTIGDFILRFNAGGEFYDIVRYNGDDTEVTIPAQINGVPIRFVLKDAFNAEKRSSNKNITKITIEEGVKEIGATAFKGCSSLTELIFPKSMEKVGNKAFENSGIEKLIVQDAYVLKFAEGALEGADKLKVLSITGASSPLTNGSLGDLSGSVSDVELGQGVGVGSGVAVGTGACVGS